VEELESRSRTPSECPAGWPSAVFEAVTDALAAALVADLKAHSTILTVNYQNGSHQDVNGVEATGATTSTAPASAGLDTGPARRPRWGGKEHRNAHRDREPTPVTRSS